MAPNETQIAAWNDPTGRTWVKFQAQLDRQLEPIGRAGIAALDVRPGESLLDVGCGAGATTVELAQAAGPSGAVLGVDVSAPLLEAAWARPARDGAARIDYLRADAQTHPFSEAGFDAVFSRFGVMFFDDPAAAFANLARAVRPGGRLAFACWRAPEANPWLTLPMQAAAGLVPPPPAAARDAPGPFAFADPEHVRRVLAAGGWRSISLDPFDERIGGSDLADTARLMTRVGPLGGALREAGADAELKAAAEAAVARALAPWVQDGRVLTPAAAWVVRAQVGG